MSLRRSAALWVAAAAVLAVAGCRQPAASPALEVAATFYPLAEFARRIGGARVMVRTVVPAGVEPHDFEPTAQTLAMVERARVLIYNGAGFEPWVGRLSAPAAGAVRVNASAGIALLPAAGGGADPHVWLDPVLAQRQAANILAGLERADPSHAPAFRANAGRLAAELRALHRRFAATLRRCARREFITTHAAFGYLARRYGLTQIAIGGASPEGEPSPRRLADLVALARARRIRVIFAEPLAGARIAQVLAAEAGAQVRVLDPLEGLSAQDLADGKDYFTVMHDNLRHLAEALDCRG